MPTLYIMCGVGFAGKSTLAKNIAKHFNIALVSQDGLFFEKKKELNLDLDSDEQWAMLLKMCQEKIEKLLLEGKSVVFDNVNLRRAHRDELRSIAEKVNAKAVVVYCETPDEILTARQEKNKETKERHDVKQEYLDDAKRQLEIPSKDESVYVFIPETNIDVFLDKLPR